MVKFIVIVKNKKNGRIVDAFGMQSNGQGFYFQESDGKWVGANFALEDAQRIAFKVLFDDNSKFLNEFVWYGGKIHQETKGKYVVEVREL